MSKTTIHVDPEAIIDAIQRDPELAERVRGELGRGDVSDEFWEELRFLRRKIKILVEVTKQNDARIADQRGALCAALGCTPDTLTEEAERVEVRLSDLRRRAETAEARVKELEYNPRGDRLDRARDAVVVAAKNWCHSLRGFAATAELLHAIDALEKLEAQAKGEQ
jgi:hypothetical protein